MRTGQKLLKSFEIHQFGLYRTIYEIIYFEKTRFSVIFCPLNEHTRWNFNYLKKQISLDSKFYKDWAKLLKSFENHQFGSCSCLFFQKTRFFVFFRLLNERARWNSNYFSKMFFWLDFKFNEDWAKIIEKFWKSPVWSVQNHLRNSFFLKNAIFGHFLFFKQACAMKFQLFLKNFFWLDSKFNEDWLIIIENIWKSSVWSVQNHLRNSFF